MRSNSLLLHGIILVGLVFGTGDAGAFEQDQRVNALTMQYGTDAFATANTLGSALVNSVVQAQIQTTIDSNIASGEASLLLAFPGLQDLTGTNEPALTVGLVNAVPVLSTNNPRAYSGAADLDWWYFPWPEGLNWDGTLQTQVAGSIVAGTFNAGPGRLSMAVGLSGDAPLGFWGMMLKANTRNPSAPLQSTNGFPPGHVASENLDPSLVSFSSMTNGQLKGNVTAASLAAMPIPSALANNGYTATNSMLDLIVNGYVYLGIITFVRPTQPDQVDTTLPVLGAGPPYRFISNTAKQVIGCQDRNGTSVSLAPALQVCAYSSYFKFTTDRVILRTPLEQWRLRYFGNIENSGDGADANDYDHDGIPNLVEFAFGLDPTQDSSGQLPTWQLTAGALVNHFAQPPGTGALSYRAEWTPSLSNPTWTAVADSGTAPDHFFAVPVGGNNTVFVRLVIELR